MHSAVTSIREHVLGLTKTIERRDIDTSVATHYHPSPTLAMDYSSLRDTFKRDAWTDTQEKVRNATRSSRYWLWLGGW